MSSTTASNPINDKEIVEEIPGFIRVYKDGTKDLPLQSPNVPPSLDDPQTGVSSKDIVISKIPSISARLYLPKFTQPNDAQKVPIFVYFHGGGFFFESAFSFVEHRYLNILVSQANVVAVSVEYRLAPEHPLPAAYDDCWAALGWVASHSTSNLTKIEPWLMNHGDFSRIFIGGDSAGGNIVHNMAMRAGVEALPGGVKILGAISSHPFFYSSTPVRSEPITGHEQSVPYLTWKLAYPNASGGIDNPMINPVGPGAPSLAGLGCSKLLVCIAGKDMVIGDRGAWYCEAVKKSGWQGKIELFEEKEEGHIYHILNPESENGKKMIKRWASFIQE